MLEDAKKAIQESSSHSSVYIGGDSIKFRKGDRWYARHSTVVILHIDSNRGCKLFHNTVIVPDWGNMKQRLLTEVMYTVQVALELIEVIGERHLEIHLDLNKSAKHGSNVAVKEALGYVTGSLPGVIVKIKPESFGASHAADHIVRGKKI